MQGVRERTAVAIAATNRLESSITCRHTSYLTDVTPYNIKIIYITMSRIPGRVRLPDICVQRRLRDPECTADLIYRVPLAQVRLDRQRSLSGVQLVPSAALPPPRPVRSQPRHGPLPDQVPL